MGHEQHAWTTSSPVDVNRTLVSLRHGFRDPTHRVMPDGVLWRTTRVPTGPATLMISQAGPCDGYVSAWGPGAQEALAGVPALIGGLDDTSTFHPGPGVVRDAYRRSVDVRIPRTGRVIEALIPAIIEQRVIARTAHEAWRWLLSVHGAPAPGPAPADMRAPPSTHEWADIPVWDFHRAGVDPRRARAVVAAALHGRRLEEANQMCPADARDRLLVIPGVGPWTAAETARRALGDADAVALGDYHLPAQIGWALVGRRVDEAEMLELLEPYRPHRYRVVLHLLVSGAARAARRGPRLAVEDHRWR